MSARDNPNRNRVFIGRLNPEARSRDLEKFFRDNGFSRLKDVNIKLGYAFVEFEDKRDADDAVYELDRKEFFGSRLTVEHATGTPREDIGGGGGRRDRSRYDGGGGGGYRGDRGYRDGDRGRNRPYNTEWRIIVQNLSSRVGWQDLKDFFRSAGEVTFTKANKEKLGEGVVEFKTYKDMQRAMRKFDGTEFFDRKIKLIDDCPGPPRDSHSRSHSRSNSRDRSKRSRSRSRSRSRQRSRRRSTRSPRRSRSRSKSRSRSRSRTPDKSKSRSRSRSKSRDSRRSHSKSPDKEEVNGD